MTSRGGPDASGAETAPHSIVVRNTASQGTSVVVLLFAALGFYSVFNRWPPQDFKTWFLCYGVVVMLTVAVRYARGRVVLGSHGFVSHDIINRRFDWERVAGFSVRGVMEIKLGVELTDGRFVLLQYHHNAPEMKRRLEAARRRAQPDGHHGPQTKADRSGPLRSVGYWLCSAGGRLTISDRAAPIEWT